jgi:hypothetical protein
VNHSFPRLATRSRFLSAIIVLLGPTLLSACGGGTGSAPVTGGASGPAVSAMVADANVAPLGTVLGAEGCSVNFVVSSYFDTKLVLDPELPSQWYLRNAGLAPGFTALT